MDYCDIIESCNIPWRIKEKLVQVLCRYRVQDSFSYFWLNLVQKTNIPSKTRENKKKKKEEKKKKRNAYDMACKL